MARFYGRFDQANESVLDSDYFDKRTLGADSASGARLRDGLIASRSALSADAYADIPLTYENGGLGTIIPVDLITTNNSTFLSWSFTYTSSATTPPAPGVIIPPNFRTRPTGSILSTNPNIGGAIQGGGVAYSVYTATTNAVSAVLNSFSSGQSPLTAINQGNNPARTLFSIWHDDGLNYFGYDNFTPGTPQTLAANATVTDTSISSSTVTIRFSASREFLNDINPNASASISARLVDVIGDPFVPAKTINITVPVSSLTTVNSTTVAYIWNVGTIIENGTAANGANLEYVSWSFIDPSINTSFGPYASTFRNTGGTSNSGTCFFRIGSN